MTGTPTWHDSGIWDPNTVYVGPYTDNAGTILRAGGGDKVEWQGGVFEANYYNIGFNPMFDTPGTDGAWQVLVAPNYNPAAPNAPLHVTAGFTSSSSVALYWDNAYVPGVGTVTSYDIFDNGVKVASTASNSFLLKGLAVGSSHSWTVEAVDATGMSAPSGALNLTTHGTETDSGRYFSPFVDMTLPSTNITKLAEASHLRDFTLAFMQGSTADMNIDTTTGTESLKANANLTVGWGGLAATTLPTGTLIQQIHALEAQGGTITVSFGGYTGRDAAVVAHQYETQQVNNSVNATTAHNNAVAHLTAEYQSVINTYGVNHLDFDIENDTVNPNAATPVMYNVVGDTEANKLRDQAIKALETANPDLKVTFTVAVNPTGLSVPYQNLLKAAKADGVRIDVVNVMAMDYASAAANQDMYAQAKSAAIATHDFLVANGINAKVGITPMIGQNDNIAEVFTLANAQSLEAWAAQQPWVAGMAMWELPRDQKETTTDLHTLTGGTAAHSDHSGVIQSAYQFAGILDGIVKGGTSAANDFGGDDTANHLMGLAGNDTLYGWGGNDTVDGGVGADSMQGGAGNDIYIVDNAGDVVDESAAGSSGIDTVQSSVAFSLADTVHARGVIQNLTLTGALNIAATGNASNNVLIGNTGNNAISGAAGNDSLVGNAGNDTLTGGAGQDTMTGGAGNDQFVFTSTADSGIAATTRDIITDFTHGSDKIVLTAIDANTVVTGNQAFVFDTTKGTATSAVATGHVAFYWIDNAGTADDHTIIKMNVDADTVIESTIDLHGLITLTAADFML